MVTAVAYYQSQQLNVADWMRRCCGYSLLVSMSLMLSRTLWTDNSISSPSAFSHHRQDPNSRILPSGFVFEMRKKKKILHHRSHLTIWNMLYVINIKISGLVFSHPVTWWNFKTREYREDFWFCLKAHLIPIFKIFKDVFVIKFSYSSPLCRGPLNTIN